MKKFLMFILFILFLAGSAHSSEFSADTVMTAQEGKATGKIFYKEDRFRMDMRTPEEMIMITRMDKKVVWNIMPGEKMYMEIPFSMQNRPRVDDKVEGEIDRKLVGSEIVDGHPAKKYLITYQSGKAKEQMYQWWATDINFPVKSSAVDGSWVQEFKNIKFGVQPNSLFELPVGYQKIQMPGGMDFNMK